MKYKPEGLEVKLQVGFETTKSYLSCAAWSGPRGFHTNAGLEVKFTARFRKMYNPKTKKTLDSIRRQKCGANYKASLFLAWERLKIYF